MPTKNPPVRNFLRSEFLALPLPFLASRPKALSGSSLGPPIASCHGLYLLFKLGPLKKSKFSFWFTSWPLKSFLLDLMTFFTDLWNSRRFLFVLVGEQRCGVETLGFVGHAIGTAHSAGKGEFLPKQAEQNKQDPKVTLFCFRTF